MPSKLFRATVANADIRSLKSRLECLYHMLVKFEQNRIVQTTRNFELFVKKKKKKKKRFFYNHQGVDAILEDVSVVEIIV